MTAAAKYLTCATHGVRKWHGDMMCNACGRVYQTSDPNKPYAATEICKCGVKLVPAASSTEVKEVLDDVVSTGGVTIDTGKGEVTKNKGFDQVDWQARPICYACFRHIAKRFAGRIPNWKAHDVPMPDFSV